MNRWLIVLSLPVLGAGALMWSPAQADEPAILSLTPARSNLGRLRAGTPIEREYVAENRSSRHVHFRELKRSCGCQDFQIGDVLVPENQSAIDFELAPGESIPVRMSLEAPGKTREFWFELTGSYCSQAVSGESHCDQSGSDSVTLRAEVRVDGYRLFDLEQAEIDLGEVPWNVERAVEWRVVANGGQRVELAGPVSSPSLTDVEVHPSGDSCVVRGKYSPRGWGSQRELIRLPLAGGSPLVGSLHAFVPEPFVIDSRFVRLGILQAGEAFEQRLDLPLRGGFGPPRSVSVEGTKAADVTAEWVDGRLTLRCDAGEASGSLSGWVVFSWGDACPEFRLPVHGFVR